MMGKGLHSTGLCVLNRLTYFDPDSLSPDNMNRIRLLRARTDSTGSPRRRGRRGAGARNLLVWGRTNGSSS